MIAHYFTLEALAAGLRNEFAVAAVTEAFTQSKNELIFTLAASGRDDRSLLVCVAPGMNALFFRDGRMRAKKNSTDIFPEIFGAALSDIRVDAFSRVMTLFAGAYRVKAHLFNNAAANVFLLGADDTVISAFRSGARFAGRPYAVSGNIEDRPDPPDAARLRELLAASDESLEKAVKKIFPWLGPLYQRELFFRAGVEGATTAADAGEGAARAISSALTDLLCNIRDLREIRKIRGPGAWLYAAPGFDREVLSAVELKHLSGRGTRSFPTVNEGIREAFSSRRRDAGIEDEKSEIVEAAERERRKVERSLKEARSRADDASAADRYRAIGTLILTHLNGLRKGETEARLADETGAEVVVRLDRSLTPAANANAYFDRARKAETARTENESRIGILAAKLAGIESLLAEIEQCDDVRAVRDIKKRLRSGRGAPIAMQGGERLPYRVFPIGEQYEAWVGKSSSDNDTLTFKHAGPHDYWMHVRGSSGSHVVLKSRSGGRFDPPKEILRAAARIAAWYSKMKKAGMVPVAYCERKYVKKPKNAPPGTVTLQREEVIFVEPALP